MRKLRRAATILVGLALWGVSLHGQQPADSVVRRQQRTLDSLTLVIRRLQARMDSLVRARAPGDTTVEDELAALRAAAAATADSASVVRPPQQARLGQNALNPEISVSGDIRFNHLRPGPQTESFSPREVEVSFQSALDPFSAAKVFVAVEDGEVDVEEGYVFFTALPGHVRLDAGKFRQQVGELNRWHLHALPEDEYPLVIRRYGGEEGLAAAGVSLYWPLPFSGRGGTYELTVQGTAGDNEVLFLDGDRASVNAQLSGFWQLGRSTFAQVSASGLYGTNPDTNLTTTLGVAAARFTWRPPQQAQSRELTLRGELWALDRSFDLPALDAFDDTRLGGYVDASWRLGRRWIASVRGDWVESPDPGPVVHEWAITPSLTFWQSEFVYVRGVYEHFRDIFTDTRDRFTIQLVFAMGPHKHELF